MHGEVFSNRLIFELKKFCNFTSLPGLHIFIYCFYFSVVYIMSYLDIDQILSEEERIPATFLLEGPGLGHLDASIDSTDLPENMVNLELPKHFERKMRDEILAGAENINLKEFSHYFFEVGSNLAIETKNEDLKTTLQIAFAGERFRSLMMHALSR